MSGAAVMMVDSDDEDYGDGDVQDLLNSVDWTSQSENEGATDAPVAGSAPQPQFTMGDVNASWNIPSKEEKMKHFSFMFGTEPNVGDGVEIPSNEDFGAGDYASLENSGSKDEISDGIGKELQYCQEQEVTGKSSERKCELVFSDDDSSDFGDDDFVFPAPAAPAAKKFSLDDLVSGIISSPLDHSTPIVKPSGDEPILQAECENVEVPGADESINVESKNLSFLDELLLSSMENVEETVEEDEDSESTSSANLENIGVDPAANIWQYKPKGYGHDFLLSTGVYQAKTRYSNSHQYMSYVLVDYLEKLHFSEDCADIMALTKPPEPLFHENQMFQPSPGYWSVTKTATALESFTTHEVQKFVCAAMNSRVKLELTLGIHEDGTVVGCVLDRCKRDVIQQAIEFALNNDIQPPISASAVEFQLKQVGPYELQKYIVQITVNDVVPTLYCPASGLYFFKDGDDIRHFSTRDEAQHFVNNEQGYKPVELWPILTEDGHQCLSPRDPHKNRRRFLVPSALAAVFLLGFAARRSLSRFL